MTYNVYNRNNKRLRSSSLDEINDDIEYEKDEKYRKNIYKYLHCLVTQNTINQDIYFLILDNDFEKIIQLLKKKNSYEISKYYTFNKYVTLQKKIEIDTLREVSIIFTNKKVYNPITILDIRMYIEMFII